MAPSMPADQHKQSVQTYELLSSNPQSQSPVAGGSQHPPAPAPAWPESPTHKAAPQQPLAICCMYS